MPDLSRRIAATFFAKARSNLHLPFDAMAAWQTHSRCGALSYSRGTNVPLMLARAHRAQVQSMRFPEYHRLRMACTNAIRPLPL